MTTTVPSSVSPSPSPPPASGHYRMRHVMRSEWTKLTSVRSSIWTAAAFVVLTVAIGVLVSAVTGSHWSHWSASERATFDPTNMSLSGLAFGELAMGVLGVLVMSGEYSTGAIRSTLSAVPRRRMVLAAKAAVFGLTALAVGEAVTFVTFLAGQAVMGSAPHASLGEPGVLRAVALSGAYLSLIGLFGLGLGTLARHSAGAIATFVGVVLVLPLVTSAFPWHLDRYTPEGILANSVAAVRPDGDHVSAWLGFGLMAVYAAAFLALAGVRLVRRDA